MIDIPVEDLVFVVCALVGGGLLLITVVVDDILGAVFDFDIGGVSLMPLLLSFISMFGVGGLFATQVLDVHGGQAAIVGAGFGLVGLGDRLRAVQRPATRRGRRAVLDERPGRRRRVRRRSASRPAATAASSSRRRARPTNSAPRPRRTSRSAPPPG